MTQLKKGNEIMKNLRFSEKHPFLFSFLMLLLLVIVQAAGVVIAQLMDLPLTSFSGYTEAVLVIILVIIVSKLGWWQEIGFRKPERPTNLLLFLPALALTIGNLTFGIAITQGTALLIFAFLAVTSGFVEEVIFRGLMLRAFLPKGEWKAVLITTAAFGLTHLVNVMAGYDPVYAVIQVCYALSIGFGFGVMVIKGRAIWPLIIAHALGNFFAFINNGQIGTQLYVVSLTYIVLFTGYGFYLMLHKNDTARPAILTNEI
jgi:membrane protease YdiL (CAAX protease family)